MSDDNSWGGWGKIGGVGGLFLAAYLVVVGISLLIGNTQIPGWFIGILATAAGILILVGR